MRSEVGLNFDTGISNVGYNFFRNAIHFPRCRDCIQLRVFSAGMIERKLNC